MIDTSIFPNERYPRRSEVYYIRKGNTTSTGSEIWSNRHAVVVSANGMNKRSNVIQVVYITTQDKSDSPLHIDVSTKTTKRTALCEQIIPVDKTRVVEYKGKLSAEQMNKIDNALAWNLHLCRYIGTNAIDKSTFDEV